MNVKGFTEIAKYSDVGEDWESRPKWQRQKIKQDD